jgi:hypothetical protein
VGVWVVAIMRAPVKVVSTALWSRFTVQTHRPFVLQKAWLHVGRMW